MIKENVKKDQYLMRELRNEKKVGKNSSLRQTKITLKPYFSFTNRSELAITGFF
jgi:hypothetical protein